MPDIVSLKNPRGGQAVAVGGSDVTLMGVVNRSPESHNKDAYAADPEAAVRLANRYARSGITVIDVGGQSTNYVNARVDEAEEIDRLVPTVEALAETGFVVSVDTFRPAVAAAAIEAGAALLNDTSGLQDDAMVAVAAERGTPVILMHLEGDQPLEVRDYDDSHGKPDRVAAALGRRLAELADRGIEQVIVDPGTGISYRTDYDRFSQSQFEIAEYLAPLTGLGAPVLYAVPRKEDRHRNVALAALAMASGAAMLRVHDAAMIGDVAWLMRRLPDKPETSS